MKLTPICEDQFRQGVIGNHHWGVYPFEVRSRLQNYKSILLLFFSIFCFAVHASELARSDNSSGNRNRDRISASHNARNAGPAAINSQMIPNLARLSDLQDSNSSNEFMESELEPLPSSDFDQMWVASTIKLPTTRKIYIDEPEVVFSEKWLDRFYAVTSSHYREKIIRDYGRSLKKELKKALVNGGWQVVNSPHKNALRVSPRMIELFIFQPDTTGLKVTIAADAGQSGVELIFQNAESSPFLKIVDYRTAKSGAFVVNRATNHRNFKTLMTDWSEGAVIYLNSIMALVEEQNQGR